MQPFSAKLEFGAKDKEEAQAISKALSLESLKMERSSSLARADNAIVRISMKAKDIVALKACFNSHCRIIEAICGVRKAALKEKD